MLPRILFLIGSVITKAVVEDGQYWHRQGAAELRRMLERRRHEGRARNVILFVGDGMGIQTHTMARIFKGQQAGGTGEETALAWEDFPFTGIIKTYNTDKQIPDSAGTATALFSGVKTRSGMLGLDMAAARNVCDPAVRERAAVPSIADWAHARGKLVGVVSTARLTHATPAAVYAHSEDRDWEDDAASPSGCGDIARQLVQALESGKINLALGGGLRHFRTAAKGGTRNDTDLVEEFMARGGKFLASEADLETWGAAERTLGLFSSSHMEWEQYRAGSGQPSLATMTRAALTRLAASPQGYLLVVEGGRIDHAHHYNQAKKAMVETLALEAAVEAALELSSREDTLVVVTADHSHAVTINGYADRGNNILGTYMDIEKGYYMSLNRSDPRPSPYTTISYANGPGFADNYNASTGFWRDLGGVDTAADEFRQLATFHLDYETHGGEDVPLYAAGPGAHLLTGVHEQSYVAHLVSYAACLQDTSHGCPDPATGRGSGAGPGAGLVLVLALLLVI